MLKKVRLFLGQSRTHATCPLGQPTTWDSEVITRYKWTASNHALYNLERDAVVVGQ
jgi:hypothetical protein